MCAGNTPEALLTRSQQIVGQLERRPGEALSFETGEEAGDVFRGYCAKGVMEE